MKIISFETENSILCYGYYCYSFARISITIIGAIFLPVIISYYGISTVCKTMLLCSWSMCVGHIRTALNKN